MEQDPSGSSSMPTGTGEATLVGGAGEIAGERSLLPNSKSSPGGLLQGTAPPAPCSRSAHDSSSCPSVSYCSAAAPRCQALHSACGWFLEHLAPAAWLTSLLSSSYRVQISLTPSFSSGRFIYHSLRQAHNSQCLAPAVPCGQQLPLWKPLGILRAEHLWEDTSPWTAFQVFLQGGYPASAPRVVPWWLLWHSQHNHAL